MPWTSTHHISTSLGWKAACLVTHNQKWIDSIIANLPFHLNLDSDMFELNDLAWVRISDWAPISFGRPSWPHLASHGKNFNQQLPNDMIWSDPWIIEQPCSLCTRILLGFLQGILQFSVLCCKFCKLWACHTQLPGHWIPWAGISDIFWVLFFILLAQVCLPTMISPSLMVCFATLGDCNLNMRWAVCWPTALPSTGLIHLIDTINLGRSPISHLSFLFSPSVSRLWAIGTYSAMTNTILSSITDDSPKCLVKSSFSWCSHREASRLLSSYTILPFCNFLALMTFTSVGCQ